MSPDGMHQVQELQEAAVLLREPSFRPTIVADGGPTPSYPAGASAPRMIAAANQEIANRRIERLLVKLPCRTVMRRLFDIRETPLLIDTPAIDPFSSAFPHVRRS